MHSLADLRAGRLAGARHLKLSEGLTGFPPEIFSLADTLEILDLSGNRLTSLPDELPCLRRLRILFCSDNPFEVLPAVLGQCPQLEMVGFKANRIHSVPGAALPPRLRWLILTDNRLTALPPEIGRCTRLQKLMLAGNRLTVLPPELAACRALELLRIAANRLEALPEWLLSMPRLAWLAFAGNPLCEAWAEEEAPAVDMLHWQALSLQRLLGQGASGHIHEALLTVGGNTSRLALKLFKGAVTSDGLPSSEIHAWLRAGRHPALIPVTGRLRGHPEGLDGLAMPLVEPSFRSLAGPPDFETCTRDVYASGTCLSPQEALAIARSIASAAAHLHARGVNHGDLYAHNLLHGGGGAVLLGDFGAASCYPAGQEGLAEALQRLEVRAFGCLLEELLTYQDEAADPGGIRPRLAAWRDACLSEVCAERPLFAALAQGLEV